MWRGSATAISRRLFKLLNDQGNRELENMLAYTASSHWFDHNELPGSASWCKTHAEEERGHAMKILDHLSLRRIEEAVTGSAGEEGDVGSASSSSGEAEAGEAAKRKPSVRQLKTEADPQASTAFTWEENPNIVLDVKGPFMTTFSDPAAIWRSALEQERENSRRFFHIMAAARETQDYVTENFLLNYFIPEQLNEEKAVEEIFSNTLLVMKRGPEYYFELDRELPSKPH
ncbi:hypothetical protein VYU27_007975 [Nannochloropsis oceanica]